MSEWESTDIKHLSLLDLVALSEKHDSIGSFEKSIDLYRKWLDASTDPMRHIATFNLACSLLKEKKLQEAEEILFELVKSHPNLKEANEVLSLLPSRKPFPTGLDGVLFDNNAPEKIEESQKQTPKQIQQKIMDTRSASTTTEAINMPDAPKDNDLEQHPLVSILIPTHNRPHYLELALKSAISQTYSKIEIVISDNSETADTKEIIEPYLKDKRIKYYWKPGCSIQENWSTCFENSSGDYVNYLMDDDLFHPQKIERMIHLFLKHPRVGMITSFRQLIDHQGNFLPPANATEKIFDNDCYINGTALGEFILLNGKNMIGEPTTVLMPRRFLNNGFWSYFDENYVLLNDVGKWLSILKDHDCIYIAEALSYFRIHSGQEQKQQSVAIRATIEWFRLLLSSHRNGAFVKDRIKFKEIAARKLESLISYLGKNYTELSNDIYRPEELRLLVNDVVGELLKP